MCALDIGGRKRIGAYRHLASQVGVADAVAATRIELDDGELDDGELAALNEPYTPLEPTYF